MKNIFILMAIAALGAYNTNANTEKETPGQSSEVTAPVETPKTVVDIAIGSADHYNFSNANAAEDINRANITNVD